MTQEYTTVHWSTRTCTQPNITHTCDTPSIAVPLTGPELVAAGDKRGSGVAVWEYASTGSSTHERRTAQAAVVDQDYKDSVGLCQEEKKRK